MKYFEKIMWKWDWIRNFNKTKSTKLNTTIIQNGKIHYKEASNCEKMDL